MDEFCYNIIQFVKIACTWEQNGQRKRKHLHIWRTRIKLLTLQGIKVSWYFYREAYTRRLLDSHKPDSHIFRRTFRRNISSNISSFGAKKCLCFCKKKMRFKWGPLCQWTIYISCIMPTLIPCNNITALLVAHLLLFIQLFQKKTQTVF